MPALELSALETRVLGCLIEKQKVTPENYPLSLHSLTAACNQATNRDPVTAYDEKTVEEGVNGLRSKKVATVVFGSGSRVQKYRHDLPEHFTLNDAEMAVVCVLLLRGPQTPGELRIRCERLWNFGRIEELEACLAELAKGEAPVVRFVPARPGQKEGRYVQLLSEASVIAESIEGGAGGVGPVLDLPPSRVEVLSGEVARLREELEQLRAEFTAFRGEFR